MAITKIGFYTKVTPALRQAMRDYKAATGCPEAQQVERALTEWLAERPEAWLAPRTKKAARTPSARTKK